MKTVTSKAYLVRSTKNLQEVRFLKSSIRCLVIFVMTACLSCGQPHILESEEPERRPDTNELKTSWRVCNQAQECTFAGDGGCPGCGHVRIEDANRGFETALEQGTVKGIRADKLEEYLSLQCGGHGCACPACVGSVEYAPGALMFSWFPACIDKLCSVVDLRTLDFTSCETNEDCELKSDTCCDAYGSNPVAIRHGELLELLDDDSSR